MSFIKKASTTNIAHKFFGLAVFFTLLFFVTTSAQAATLSVSPSGGTVTVGKTITVHVLVNSGGQSVNAVSGAVTFSSSTLTLTDISKSGIVTLWAQDPTYSNAAGTASFQGVILSGYSGGGGTVVSLTFKAKAQGPATINISSSGSSVLLNDGQGTNALSSTSGASFNVVQGSTATPPAQQVTPPPAQQPSTPIVPTAPLVPATPSSAAPLFTDYQSPVLPGNFVVVKGTSDADSTVRLTVTQTDSNGVTTVTQASLPTSDSGEFTYVSDQKVAEGSTYTLVATNSEGQSTAPLALAVKNTIWFSLAALIAALIAIKMSVALALLLILLVTWYLLRRNRMLKKRLQVAIDKISTMQPKQ